MKTLLILTAALALTACAPKPPKCTEAFFYNDVPGCKEAVLKWSTEHPEAAAEFFAERQLEAHKMMGDLFKNILKEDSK